MNSTSNVRPGRMLRVLGVCLPMLALWLGGPGSSGARAAERVLYQTGFESSEGFNPELTLIGQSGWVGYGSGGNGLVTGFFAGKGQHAFVGFTAPTNNGDFLNVWRPVNYAPGGATNPPRVAFTVLMSIEDSVSVTNRDDFRWSVYNSGGDRLFTLDFDNNALGINYLLDGNNQYVATGRTFTNGVTYQLRLDMDFSQNRWSAALDGRLVVTNLAISTTNAPLNLGDVDAVWAIRKPGSPGDNYMVFDDYRIEAVAPATNPPPRVEAQGLLRPGEFLVRTHGTTGVRYVLQSSPDLRLWSGIKTNLMPVDGYFDHLDKEGGPRRFYRALEP